MLKALLSTGGEGSAGRVEGVSVGDVVEGQIREGGYAVDRADRRRSAERGLAWIAAEDEGDGAGGAGDHVPTGILNGDLNGGRDGGVDGGGDRLDGEGELGGWADRDGVGCGCDGAVDRTAVGGDGLDGLRGGDGEGTGVEGGGGGGAGAVLGVVDGGAGRCVRDGDGLGGGEAARGGGDDRRGGGWGGDGGGLGEKVAVLSRSNGAAGTVVPAAVKVTGPDGTPEVWPVKRAVRTVWPEARMGVGVAVMVPELVAREARVRVIAGEGVVQTGFPPDLVKQRPSETLVPGVEEAKAGGTGTLRARLGRNVAWALPREPKETELVAPLVRESESRPLIGMVRVLGAA